MNTQPKEIRLYRTAEGHCPYEEWLARLNDNAAEMRIDVRLGRLQMGNPGDVKAVGEGVSELRIDYGPGYPGLLRTGWRDAGDSVMRGQQTYPNCGHQAGQKVLGRLSATRQRKRDKVMTEDTLTRSYQDFLLERLRDPDKAMAYLNAALEEEDEQFFLFALRNVAEARQLPLLSAQLQWSDVPRLLNALGIRLQLDLKRAA